MHPTDEELFRYVTDDLSSKHAQALEAHVSGCAHCHSRLREQAEIEVFCNELSEQLQLPAVSGKPFAEAKHFGVSRGLVPVAVALLYLIPMPGSVSLPAVEPAAKASTSTPARLAASPSTVALTSRNFTKNTRLPPALTAGQITTPKDAGRAAGLRAPPCSRAPLC